MDHSILTKFIRLMTIFYNDVPMTLPNNYMTLADLAQLKQVPPQGSAIALNDKLIKRDAWSVTPLNENDRVTVISAAFGG